MNLDSAPICTESVVNVNPVGVGLTETRSSSGRTSGNGALSSTNTYVGMSTAASRGGVMQARVVLLSTVQGDCKGGGGGEHLIARKLTGELTLAPLENAS